MVNAGLYSIHPSLRVSLLKTLRKYSLIQFKVHMQTPKVHDNKKKEVEDTPTFNTDHKAKGPEALPKQENKTQTTTALAADFAYAPFAECSSMTRNAATTTAADNAETLTPDPGVTAVAHAAPTCAIALVYETASPPAGPTSASSAQHRSASARTESHNDWKRRQSRNNQKRRQRSTAGTKPRTLGPCRSKTGKNKRKHDKEP